MSVTASYTYDELDNLHTVSISGGPAPRDHLYHYDENNTWWLTSVTLENCDTRDTQGDLIFSDRFQGGCNGTPETNFYYDTRGNLSHRNNITYDFDLGNRLRKVEELRTSRYEYDGHGRRVSDWTDGSGVGYRYSFYTADGRLSYATDDRRGVLSFYIYLGDSLVAVRERDAGGVDTNWFQHTDALGSPVVVTDDMQQVVTRYQHERYGKVHDRIPYAAPPDGPGYTGHLFDSATGLNYMQQRYYDPGIGRFISADPVGADQETGALFNRYMYAANNPYRFYDPDGRCTGSRLQDSDGACMSTGGFTTQDFGVRSFETSGSNNKIPLPNHNFRPGGRGTNLDDAARVRQGLAPRTRFQNAQSSRDLKDFGSPGRGRPGRPVREFTGDFNDAAQLIRQFSPSGRLTRTGTIKDGRGQPIGATFRGANGETFSLRVRSRGGQATPG